MEGKSSDLDEALEALDYYEQHRSSFDFMINEWWHNSGPLPLQAEAAEKYAKDVLWENEGIQVEIVKNQKVNSLGLYFYDRERGKAIILIDKSLSERQTRQVFAHEIVELGSENRIVIDNNAISIQHSYMEGPQRLTVEKVAGELLNRSLDFRTAVRSRHPLHGILEKRDPVRQDFKYITDRLQHYQYKLNAISKEIEKLAGEYGIGDNISHIEFKTYWLLADGQGSLYFWLRDVVLVNSDVVPRPSASEREFHENAILVSYRRLRPISEIIAHLCFHCVFAGEKVPGDLRLEILDWGNIECNIHLIGRLTSVVEENTYSPSFLTQTNNSLQRARYKIPNTNEEVMCYCDGLIWRSYYYGSNRKLGKNIFGENPYRPSAPNLGRQLHKTAAIVDKSALLRRIMLKTPPAIQNGVDTQKLKSLGLRRLISSEGEMREPILIEGISSLESFYEEGKDEGEDST